MKATPDSTPPFKFKNAALLNRLSEMAQVPYYATACHTLIQAEMAIVELERENATLRAEVERLAAQAASAPAVRMLTDGEFEAACGHFHDPSKVRAAIKAFCAVNAGKHIPADGKIGGVL